MKIKTKLGIGYALLLLLFAGVTAFGYLQLTQMNQSLELFYENRFEKVKIALAVRGEVNASGRVMNDMMLGDQDPAQAIADIGRRLGGAEQQYRILEGMQLGPEELDTIGRIEQLTNRYGTSVRQFISLVEESKIEEAKQFYADKLRDEQREVIDLMDELVSVQEISLREEMADSKETYDWSMRMVAMLTVVGLLLGMGIVLWVFPSINQGLNLLERMADRFARGRLRSFARIEVQSKDELGALAALFKRIALDLQEKNEREARLSEVQQRQARINAQLARVTELLQEGTDAKGVAQSFIAEFAPVLGAAHGLIYLSDPASAGTRLELAGTYAAAAGGGEGGFAIPEALRSGEGLAGQCFRDAKPIEVDKVPGGFFKIGSGLGEIEPGSLIVHPIVFDDSVIGVVELAAFESFEPENRELLEALSEKLGTILNNIRSRQRFE